MRTATRFRATAAIIALVGMAAPPTLLGEVLICKRGHRLTLRETACKRRETRVDAAQLGVTGPPGPGARWAFVNSDGTVIAQSGGISVASAGSGAYVLDFGTSLAGKTLGATPAATAADQGYRGVVVAGVCGGAQSYTAICGALDPPALDDRHAWVVTTNVNNVGPEAHAFYLAAY